MLGGLVEAAVGGVLVAIPEPATTGAGTTMVVDGVRRAVKDL
ncbi:hypothetical protein SAMN04488598_1686 [Halanaerobium congolense]|jgi:hypothetical protein|uniref:Uncharacterized protein n=1 Tax=Halanaerobium congolense TaxID=54121 RepID=A0A1I0D1Q2_9FIRM|nr:hypothetical protein [Halanaerobium congolense]PTX14777.1 hypothetical protein C7953_2838 [Halanaerobium congolense]SDG23955.1 hypothetical protein SAMN04488598_1686 [Halanaerobium congolense]SET26007.1 hypothetical protein SAMN04515652_15310 [Halanaerobium congolense]SFP77250.1 hypothetical protein SAMN04488596_15710 [Halanaerobium congolense]